MLRIKLICVFCLIIFTTSAQAEINTEKEAVEYCLKVHDEAVLIKSENQFQEILELYRNNGISLNSRKGRYKADYFEHEPRSFDIITKKIDQDFYITFTLYQTVKTHMGNYGKLARYKYKLSQYDGVIGIDDISTVKYLSGPSYAWQCAGESELCFNQTDGELLAQFKANLYAMLDGSEKGEK